MRRTKTGSSRRKGDEYQDLTALQLVLESYIDRHDFQVFIEYEKAGSLDDVVIVLPDSVDAYQVKHAVSDNAVYVTDDLTVPKSVIFVEKFAKSWKKLLTEFPSRQLTLHLRSNRALDAQFAEVVTGDGFFNDKFRENRYRKEKRKLRAAIFESTGLSEKEFQQFLTSFHFDLKRPSWLELEKHIQAVLLDHKLGISDRRVFADLKRLVERHAIEVPSPITPQLIDSFLSKTQTRYLLPHSFFVDKELFVNPPTLKEQLDVQLDKADGEYVVVTGPPGSGKSTALSEYCDQLEENTSDRFIVVRYYCFVRVHDNRQRLRLEAKSLRVNLLTGLQRRFPSVLDDRRFDFSEDRFYEAFERVARHCGNERKKLVIFLDGLDHVERDDEIRDNVIDALPAEIPENVVVLIGTQELHRWKPIALKEGREERHIVMPLFSLDETRTYIVDRCDIAVPDETIHQVFEKSTGLPLYLRYIAEMLSSSDDHVATIESIPAAVDGDVRSYYETLWAGFDTEGRSDARYLSFVLASLRFSVHEDELIKFQVGIPDTPRFEAAYRRVQHLLRRDDTLVSIFHNSFRVFVLERTNETTLCEIAAGILSRLKQEELQSARWFKYSFRYALEAGEFNYVLDNVNRGFVDAALMRFRSADEITDGIECGIEAAGATADLVALSRLGSLKYRTHERLEYTFPWSVLTDILLYEGRIDQVVDSIYSEESDRVMASENDSLQIILRLVDLGKNELSEKLFSAILKNFRRSNELGKDSIVTMARCSGMFKTRPEGVMRWLSGITFQRDILEPEELAAEYAPHLAAYLDGLVRSGRDNVWSKLKRLNSPFSNQLIRQLTIRAIANWKSIDELRCEVEEYVVNHAKDTNIELAFYAAKAGLSADFVNRLAGRFDFPPEFATHETRRTDLQSHILRFAYWAVVFGYEQNDDVVRQLRVRVRGSKAVWACTQEHLLKVGEVLGSHFADREIDWFCRATEAIEALENAGHAAGERTPDALDTARSILDTSLRWLSDVVIERCQERVTDWAALLERLRSSFIWTCHYGIGEAETNYSFEFPIWEKQTDLPNMRAQLRSVFVNCAKSYDDALSLKGGLRGEHFLKLAALAAKCGYRSDSSLWFKRGIETSLAYGYRKDVTLENLVDVLTLLGKHSPERVLGSAAAILELIKWVHNATDGRSTKHFAQHLLPTIVANNRAAALEVLRIYYEEFARWQADESVTKYILARDDGDPEFLWALCGLLDPNESLESRQHVAALAASIDPDSTEAWAARLSDYIKTMINPRHWPDELWEKATQIHERPVRKQRYEGSSRGDLNDKTYVFEGQSITWAQVNERCRASFNELVETIEKLKQENDYIPDYELFAALPDHIENAANIEELETIKSFFEKHAPWDKATNWETIGRRYLTLGDTSSGLKCLERAIHESPMSKALTALIDYDRDRAEAFLIADLSEKLQGPSYQGYDAPKIIANACDLLGNTEALEQVFNDFLRYSQELFSQWPRDRSFDELRDWGDTDREEDIQIIHLLVDRLGTHATELGNRLIFSICSLAESRDAKVFPVLTDRLTSASGLQLWRLLQVFVRLSHSNRPLFREHCHELKSLFDRGDTFMALTALQAIQTAYSDGTPMPEELKQRVEEVVRRYSSIILYRNFGILKTTPSEDFVDLTKRAAQFSFHRQLKAVCQILSLDLEDVTAQLERRLLETGTTLDEEMEIARSMNNAFVHPQGWPIIMFVSDFHVQISSLLYQTIDEVLSKQRYQPNHLEAVWRVIQPNDPEYSVSKLVPMPEDISPLLVYTKDDWIASDRQEPTVTIEDTLPEKWVTVFEFRQLAQDSPYHREFVTQTHVRSALIVPERIDDVASFDPALWEEVVGTHHPEENLTWQQFRDALRDGHQLEPESDEACLPFVSYCERHAGFLGFHTITSLSSKIIREQKLQLDGSSVFADEERVAYFEAWQEGYPDDDYDDEPLSFGVRLRVNTNYVKQVCQSMGRTFAIRTTENRFVLKDYQREPAESCSYTSIRVWPIDVMPLDH